MLSPRVKSRLMSSRLSGINSHPAQIRFTPGKPDYDLKVEYLGRLEIAISGRFTGKIYQFNPFQPIQQVDPRDASICWRADVSGSHHELGAPLPRRTRQDHEAPNAFRHSPARMFSIVHTACDTIPVYSHGGVKLAIPLIRCEVRCGSSRGRPADAGAFCRIFHWLAQAKAPVAPSVFPRYRRCLPGNIRASV